MPPERPKSDWIRDSFAVVISNGKGRGWVHATVGPAVEREIENCGHRIEDLGLSDAPNGVSVWEGRYIYTEYYNTEVYYPMVDSESELVGEFREPTEAEWARIEQDEVPWTEEEWLALTEHQVKPPTQP